MAATLAIIAAFITVTGFVSAQLPFNALPDYGIGDIGFGQLGGAGAFTHGFGPLQGGPFPSYGMSHSMPWHTSVGGPVGTTHTVTHTPGGGVQHHTTHVSTSSKTVTVGHHMPATHVTTVHHPASAGTTHVQHVNYGAGLPGTFSPFAYGPSPFPGGPGGAFTGGAFTGGAFTGGPFMGGSLPYYGMPQPMPWPASVGGPLGTTHTVTHTSGAGVPHHSTQVSTSSKTVTVGHHMPATHVTTVHHPGSVVGTHVQHVNYGPGFPGTAPFPPYSYGPAAFPGGPFPGGPFPGGPFPGAHFQGGLFQGGLFQGGLFQGGPYYGMSHPMPWPASVGGPFHTVTHTTGSGVPHHTTTHVSTSKTVTVGHHMPSTQHVTTVHHPGQMVTNHVQHVNYGTGFPGVSPYFPMAYGPGFSHFGPQHVTSVVGHPTTPVLTHTTTTHHQTVPHGFGITHVSTGFPGAFPGGYQQTYPAVGYGYDSLPGTFGPAIGTLGNPFPYVHAGIHNGAVSSTAVHTVHHHPGVVPHPMYPGGYAGHPYGSYNPYGPVVTTVVKHTKTTSSGSKKV